jgi:adenosine deaminase
MKPQSRVELHLHLDCSLSYQVVSRLAPSISRKEFEAEFIAPPQCSSLTDFLTRAPRGFQLMQDRESLQLVTEDVFGQLAADGVLYAEIRFAPLLHLAKGMTPEAVVAAVDCAAEQGIRDTGVEARLILCTLRHFTEEQSVATAKLVEQFKGSRVVGLDIAGDEAGFSIDAHLKCFRYAIDRGLNRTAHAGEASGPGSLWETLRAFEPSRIGHGVRSIEDPALVEFLGDEGIHLEVCPSSNVQTCVCAAYGEHPVDRLFRAGVSLGISTDTRTITNVTLDEEYARLRQHFGWSEAEFLICNQNALQAAFVEEPVKTRLATQLIRSTAASG